MSVVDLTDRQDVCLYVCMSACLPVCLCLVAVVSNGTTGNVCRRAQIAPCGSRAKKKQRGAHAETTAAGQVPQRLQT